LQENEYVGYLIKILWLNIKDSNFKNNSKIIWILNKTLENNLKIMILIKFSPLNSNYICTRRQEHDNLHEITLFKVTNISKEVLLDKDFLNNTSLFNGFFF
jgi:hypothetical protein